MSRALITEGYLTDIADAIRAKNGSSDTYTPPQMAAAIQAIPTGITPTGTLEITENGTYDVTQYASVNINVSGGGGSVTIVPWATGTDEEIVAMIDAAHAGVIDLQTDGGWAVGDVRTIHVDAFTGGGNVSHAAQDIQIVITSFEEYMECGNVLQFDFKTVTTTGGRMYSQDAKVGYGDSEMKQTTLPALLNALPTWMKSKMVEFSVQAYEYDADTDTFNLTTVSGNKLALRSIVEVYGMSQGGNDGLKQMEYYSSNANRTKKRSNNTTGYWWLRTPFRVDTRYYYVGYDGYKTNYVPTNSGVQISPFGCL